MITPRSFIHARKPSPSFTQTRRRASKPTPSTNHPCLLSPQNNDISAAHLPAPGQQHLDVSMDNAINTGLLSPPNSPPSRTNNLPPTTMTATAAQSITPSGAVQIPINKQRHYLQKSASRTRSSSARRARELHSPDAVPPAVAALLAITSIPPPKRRKSLRQKESNDWRMTVDSIVPRSRVSEKDLSQELRWDIEDDLSSASLERSPLEFLLTPPDELEEEDVLLHTESGFASPYSTRTGSFDSLPSLGDSVSSSTVPSADFPITPRGGRLRCPRRSLKPVTTSPGEQPEDPLSRVAPEQEQLDFGAKPTMVTKQAQPSVPFKSVFKSNLTASLRALRSAARTLSTFTASSIPPDDFLTRSILTIDPRVPFTDERRPPVLEEEPSEAMRRYLNPASNIRPEARGTSPIRSYTASIQMQTYKVQRSRGTSRAARQTAQASNSSKASTVVLLPPGPRQREMRENPDFIRIAVMEHLMRKRGKLDDQREGHARWLLPPRKSVTKPYEIGPGGVPVRWMSIPQDD